MEFSNRAASCSSDCSLGASFVTRCWGNVPLTRSGALPYRVIFTFRLIVKLGSEQFSHLGRVRKGMSIKNLPDFILQLPYDIIIYLCLTMHHVKIVKPLGQCWFKCHYVN
uniref:Uncharacterized protein n=1 Tax=Cacopsylla melanoneura TaxID=428564 RepID=A0A8D8YHA9_9HEMI